MGTRDIRVLACQAIAKAGGCASLGRQLGLWKTSVQQWKNTGVPVLRVPEVSRITGIPWQDIRPDFFVPAGPLRHDSTSSSHGEAPSLTLAACIR